MSQRSSMIYLKDLTPQDVDQSYADWMNDSEVVRYLESRGRHYTLEDVRNYVSTISKSGSDRIFGIHLLANDRHIGNVKIGHIDSIHLNADIGILIGDRTQWGKGYATQTLRLSEEIAFKEIGLHKLWAGIYCTNTASYKAFIKAGYREVGILREHRMCEGKFIDQYIMELLKS